MPVDPILLDSLGIWDPYERAQINDQVEATLAGQVAATRTVTPGPVTQPGAGTPLPSTQITQQDALARLRQVLSSYELNGLSEWAWQQLVTGQSEDQILISMHEQPEYQKRFPYEKALRDAGLPALSPAEMLRTEAEYKRIQQRFGAAPSKNPSDYVGLFTGQVSPNEFQDRLVLYDKLRTTYAPYIRQQFADQARISNVRDEDLYGLLSGQDKTLATRYAETTGTPLHLPSFADLQRAEQKALEIQQSVFSGGDGVQTDENPYQVARRREAAI